MNGLRGNDSKSNRLHLISFDQLCSMKATQIKRLPKPFACFLAFVRTVTLKLMSTRSCYYTHTSLCLAIFDYPGDQLTVSTKSPRYNARSGCAQYKSRLTSLLSGCPRDSSLPNIGSDPSVVLPEVVNLGQV